MKKRYYITLIILLAVIAAGNIFGSAILNGAYKDLVIRAEEAAKATPQPAPEPTPTPTPTPVPTRPPREGDICANFPDYDTGVNADYSYQSDEVRIAITKYINYPEAYFIADVWIRNLDAFKTVFPSDQYLSTPLPATDISAHNNAILAANADFISGIVIRNGEIFRSKFRNNQEILVMNWDGSMAAEKLQWDSSAEDLLNRGVWNTWCFGPILIQNEEICVTPDGLRNPKTALGYYEPGHYCLFVCDGRQNNYAVGMDNSEVAEIMKELGVTMAYNMDGGASSQMVYQNEYVNSPSTDYDGSVRTLTNMICIVEPE